MKVCRGLIDNNQVFTNDGDVRLCGWLYARYQSVGKLTEQTAEEIWSGEKTKRVFETLAKQDYSMCNHNDCVYLLTQGEEGVPLIELEEIPKHPTHLSVSYEETCNYRCTVCAQCTEGRFDSKSYQEKVRQNADIIEKNLDPVLPNLIRIGANGCGELFASPHVLRQLANWKPVRPPGEVNVRLETNGSLFTEENWKKIENLGQYYVFVVVTVMSFDEHTYQHLSGVKYPISRIENNLRFIKSLRDKGDINHFEITTVVQESNFRTLPEFFRRCVEEFGADSVRLRPYCAYGYDKEREWFRDVRNVQHPCHKEYLEILKDPIFNHPKFVDWGVLNDTHDKPSPYSEVKALRDGESEILCQMLNDDSGLVKLENLVQENGGKVIIHGAGVLGRTIAKNLTERGNVKIDHITDFRQCGEFLGIPIINLHERNDDGNPIPNSQDKTLPVLVTWLETEQRHFDYFRSLGYTGKFIKLNEIFDYNCGCDCK